MYIVLRQPQAVIELIHTDWHALVSQLSRAAVKSCARQLYTGSASTDARLLEAWVVQT